MSIGKTSLLVFILLNHLLNQATSYVAVYITPKTPTVPCPASEICLELSEYSLKSQKENNTDLVFLPGEHILSVPLVFKDLVNISMSGILGKYGQSVIKGSGSKGSLTFDTVSNSVICNVSFTNYGDESNETVSFTNCHNATIMNSKFTHEADSAHNLFGGAIHINRCNDVSILNTEFIGNRGISGGALYIYQSSISVLKSLFYNNTARNFGGAVFTAESTLYIQDSTFLNNTANVGGAVSTSQGSVSISYSTFDRNRATRYGGSV